MILLFIRRQQTRVIAGGCIPKSVVVPGESRHCKQSGARNDPEREPKSRCPRAWVFKLLRYAENQICPNKVSKLTTSGRNIDKIDWKRGRLGLMTGKRKAACRVGLRNPDTIKSRAKSEEDIVVYVPDPLNRRAHSSFLTTLNLSNDNACPRSPSTPALGRPVQ